MMMATSHPDAGIVTEEIVMTEEAMLDTFVLMSQVNYGGVREAAVCGVKSEVADNLEICYVNEAESYEYMPEDENEFIYLIVVKIFVVDR